MSSVVIAPIAWGQSVRGVPGQNERCIELPLACALMAFTQPGRILDAGCALNVREIEDLEADLTHATITLHSERQVRHPRRSYVAADLRDLSRFPDGSFDRVACVSTLEHVGMDNHEKYHGAVETNPDSVTFATRELWRVTKDLLFITAPFRTEPWACAWWRYFTMDTLWQIIPACPESNPAEVGFYAKKADGWAGPFGEPQAVEEADPLTENSVSQIVVVKACK